MTSSAMQCNISILVEVELLQQFVCPFGNCDHFCLFTMSIRHLMPASFDGTLFAVGRLYNTRYKPLTDRTSTS